MKQSIFDNLRDVDGVMGIAVLDSNVPLDSNDDMLTLHVRAIQLARVSGCDTISVLIGEKDLRRKFVACTWPRFHVSVEVIPGHPVNKSLQRILRRTGVRFGGLEVESKPPRIPPCDTEPPVASSSAPTMEPSSPSPVDATPATGGSQEAR